jgi:hypothetical protein
MFVLEETNGSLGERTQDVIDGAGVDTEIGEPSLNAADGFERIERSREEMVLFEFVFRSELERQLFHPWVDVSLDLTIIIGCSLCHDAAGPEECPRYFSARLVVFEYADSKLCRFKNSSETMTILGGTRFLFGVWTRDGEQVTGAEQEWIAIVAQLFIRGVFPYMIAEHAGFIGDAGQALSLLDAMVL